MENIWQKSYPAGVPAEINRINTVRWWKCLRKRSALRRQARIRQSDDSNELSRAGQEIARFRRLSAKRSGA